jgi:hypothetical protein
MPYPMPSTSQMSGDRVRLLPPLGCPGRGEWVVPHEVPRWLELGFREAPVPPPDLELSWMPAKLRWDEPALSRAVLLLVHPRALPPQPIQVAWGDGDTETVSWSPFDPRVPEPRHVYAAIEDVTVTVTVGLQVSTLPISLLSCPLPVRAPRGTGDHPMAGPGMALVPGAGLGGNAFDGSRNEQWHLRLHPEGGLGLLPSPVDGQPSLVVMHGSGAASRGVRWYAGEGPPTLEWQATAQPPPAVGDFYLDRLTGHVHELAS